ncbi:DinB family protein [Actinosynnema sp. NPDC020468]|uniref:DinB family protein n=1 Tax=Actinosynnema sp. NPDC020468 TaxID=3154488 RepID=UPI00340613F2
MGAKKALLEYLQTGRDALVWKLEGASEYDVRRPLTVTGTNLLGLVKHVAAVEAAYLCDTFGRPFPEEFGCFADGAEVNDDMWATADESREDLVAQYRRVWAHSDATVELLDLDALGTVPHWPAERGPVTLHEILVRVIAETHRHAGHADIVRELVDGSAGMIPGNENLPGEGAEWWAAYRERLQRVADGFR